MGWQLHRSREIIVDYHLVTHVTVIFSSDRRILTRDSTHASFHSHLQLRTLWRQLTRSMDSFSNNKRLCLAILTEPLLSRLHPWVRYFNMDLLILTKAAQKIIGCPLTSLMDMYTSLPPQQKKKHH